MLAMEFIHRCMIVLTVSAFLNWNMASSERACPRIQLQNGRIRERSKGKLASFRCKRNFELVGAKFAVCLDSGQWSQPVPTCVGTTCSKPDGTPNLIVEELYNGGVLKFTCGAGLTRSGPETIMCNGIKWTDAPPKCIEGISLGCDFEYQGLCGWSQDTDDDFDWSWNKGETPTAETGPRFDHTTNSSEGHYLFMEASAPQTNGQKTRLVSPGYTPKSSDSLCLEFYYHMYGPQGAGQVGDLDVYVKPAATKTTMMDTAQKIFNSSGNHGDLWKRAKVKVPVQSEIFQIVFQATRRKSWTGDIAIDDIKLHDCLEENSTNSPSPDNDANDNDDDDSSNDSESDSAANKATEKRQPTTSQISESTTAVKANPTTEQWRHSSAVLISLQSTKIVRPEETSVTTASTTASTMRVTPSANKITTQDGTTYHTTKSSTTTSKPTPETTIVAQTSPTTATTTTPAATTTTAATTTITSTTTTSTTTTAATTATTIITTTTTTEAPTTSTPISTTLTSTTPIPTVATFTTILTTETTTPTTTASILTTAVSSEPTTTSEVTEPSTTTETTSISREITEMTSQPPFSEIMTSSDDVMKSSDDVMKSSDDVMNTQQSLTTTLLPTSIDSEAIDHKNETDSSDDNDGNDYNNNEEENNDTDENESYDENSDDNNSDKGNNLNEDTTKAVETDFAEFNFTDAGDHRSSNFHDFSDKNDSQTSLHHHDNTINKDFSDTTSDDERETAERKTEDGSDAKAGQVKGSSTSTKEMIPIIVGVAAAVLVAAVVIAVLAWVWARNQRRKQEKEQEDQMNIITEYVETNLSI